MLTWANPAPDHSVGAEHDDSGLVDDLEFLSEGPGRIKAVGQINELIDQISEGNRFVAETAHTDAAN